MGEGIVGRLSIECGGDGRVRSFRLWAFCNSLSREMRTRCWANRSLAEAVMAVVVVVAMDEHRSRSGSTSSVMAKKGTKATRKFAASGQLTKKIKARRKHQHIQRKIIKNKGTRSKGRELAHVEPEDEDERANETKSSKKRYATLISHSM